MTSAPHAEGEAGRVEPLIGADETAFPPAPMENEILRSHRALHDRTPGATEANAWNWPPPDPAEASNNPVPEREYQGPPILIHTASNRFIRPSATRKSTGVFHSFPNSPANASPLPLPNIAGGQTPQTGTTTEVASDDEVGADEFPLPAPTRTHRAPSWWRRTKKKLRSAWTAFNDFMTVPLWAALASLIVALIQPLQHTLEVHLPPIKNALEQSGKCSIPVTLIVLGAYFYQPVDKDAAANQTGGIRLSNEPEPNGQDGGAQLRSNRLSQVSLVGSVKSMFSLDTLGKAMHLHRHQDTQEEVHAGETRTVWVAVLSRMVITPLILLPAIALSAKTDWHQVFEE